MWLQIQKALSSRFMFIVSTVQQVQFWVQIDDEDVRRQKIMARWHSPHDTDNAAPCLQMHLKCHVIIEQENHFIFLFHTNCVFLHSF